MSKKFLELTEEEVWGKNKIEMLKILDIDPVDWDMMSELEQCETLGIPMNKWFKMPDHLYHNTLTPGLSSSGMKTIDRKCLRVYRYFKDNPTFKTTDALVIGRAVHSFILEPKEFNKEFAFYPSKLRKNSAAYNKYVDMNQGKTLLKDSVQEMLDGIKKSIEDFGFMPIIKEAQKELAIFTHDSTNNVVLRVKADAVHTKVVIDLKSTTSANPKDFSRTIAEYDYDLQHWLYLRVCELAKLPKAAFMFLAVEKESPYMCSAITINQEDINVYTSKLAEQIIKEYGDAIRTGYWKGYEETKDYKIVQVDIPNYKKYEIDEKTGFTCSKQ